jgi:hypothetical protein
VPLRQLAQRDPAVHDLHVRAGRHPFTAVNMAAAFVLANVAALRASKNMR